MKSFRSVSLTAFSRVSAGALSAALLIGAAGSLPAAHADDISWGINPGGEEERSSFSYELDPGQSLEDSFEITNYGTVPLQLSVYGADGSTSANGALELLPASEASTHIGAWIDVSEPTISLDSGEQTEVDFTLNIPENVAPGDYVGGMISSYMDTSSGSTVAVDQRLATMLAVRVGGEGNLSLKLGDTSASAPIGWNPFAPVTAELSTQLSNEGTLRSRGTYAVTISGIFGWGSTTQTFAVDEMLPGSAIEFTAEVSGLWPLIWQQYEVALTPEGIDGLSGEPVVASGSFWSIPAGWIGILLLVALAATIMVIIRRRNYEYVYEDEEVNLLESSSTK